MTLCVRHLPVGVLVNQLNQLAICIERSLEMSVLQYEKSIFGGVGCICIITLE